MQAWLRTHRDAPASASLERELKVEAATPSQNFFGFCTGFVFRANQRKSSITRQHLPLTQVDPNHCLINIKIAWRVGLLEV